MLLHILVHTHNGVIDIRISSNKLVICRYMQKKEIKKLNS